MSYGEIERSMSSYKSSRSSTTAGFSSSTSGRTSPLRFQQNISELDSLLDDLNTARNKPGLNGQISSSTTSKMQYTTGGSGGSGGRGGGSLLKIDGFDESKLPPGSQVSKSMRTYNYSSSSAAQRTTSSTTGGDKNKQPAPLSSPKLVRRATTPTRDIRPSSPTRDIRPLSPTRDIRPSSPVTSSSYLSRSTPTPQPYTDDIPASGHSITTMRSFYSSGTTGEPSPGGPISQPHQMPIPSNRGHHRDLPDQTVQVRHFYADDRVDGQPPPVITTNRGPPKAFPPMGHTPEGHTTYTYYSTSSSQTIPGPAYANGPAAFPVTDYDSQPPKQLSYRMAALSVEDQMMASTDIRSHVVNVGDDDLRQRHRQPALPPPSVHDRLMEKEQIKEKEVKILSQNVAGAPVYYPPGELFNGTMKEAGSAQTQGKMKMKEKYKYKAGSKEKSSSGGGVVPVCLPVCCAMPCVIL